ncbi:AAA family ATPase, partial [Vibrio harveyi]|uniref:AAA family ATPase n=1 Tax=Vibrio harveyi TaxID=669 RepID=UPI0009BA62FF
VTCIVREGNKVVNCLSEFEELKRLNIKADQSIISLIDDYDFYSDMPDLLDIRHKFIRMLTNVNQDGYRSNNDLEDYLLASKFYHRSPEALEFCEFIIRGVDPGVTSINIEESVDKKTGDTVYYPMFAHTFGDDIFEIGINYESMGSRSLFYQLYRYWMVIRDGGLLLLDEFDTHLHSMILPELIQLFTDKRINTHNAQLIITAHNTEIIDSLGRSRVVLVNKAGNESYSYRLDEVSMLRNDRPITPVYMKGKIGGTPEGVIGLTSRLADKWESETING